MLMDEPFGALDPVTRARIASDYRTLHSRLSLTTIMVTHDVLEALLMADRVVIMDGGQIVADSTPGALLRGHPDRRVSSLIDMPRRQAERLAQLASGVCSEGELG